MPVLGQDTGGQGYRIVQAFKQLDPSFEVRSMVSKNSFIDYPRDLPFDMKVMQKMYDAADVIHTRNNLGAYQHLDRNQGKPIVIHHQGTAYRTKSHYLHTVCTEVGAIQCVSTIDLELIHGHPWLPSPFEVDEMTALGKEIRETRTDERVVITHAPTNRHIKGTRYVIQAVERLKMEGLPVHLDLIEGRPWRECLERKAKSDIYIDQFELGYGNNAIEAWLLGLPVVAGTHDPKVARKMVEHIGYLPYVHSTERGLVDTLRTLVKSNLAREEAQAVGIGYVREFHDGRRTVAILRDLWLSAKPTVGSGKLRYAEGRAMHPPRTGVMATFRGTKYPALMIRLGERRFKFVGGRLVVDDADAPIIEEFAARRPEYAIVRESAAPSEPAYEPPTLKLGTGEAAVVIDPTPAESEEELEVASEEDYPYVEVSAKELRDEARAWDLSAGGSKDKLWERLAEAYADEAAYQEEAAA